MSAPFGGAFPGKKKRPLSMKDQYGIDLWDKSRKTSAVPPKLAQCAHSATCHHTPFLGNGGKARRTLPPHGVSSALCSPFGKVVSAALAPAGSSLGKTQTLAYSSASVVCCFELGASVRSGQAVCQAGKRAFSAIHKHGRLRASIFRPFNIRPNGKKTGCCSHVPSA